MPETKLQKRPDHSPVPENSGGHPDLRADLEALRLLIERAAQPDQWLTTDEVLQHLASVDEASAA